MSIDYVDLMNSISEFGDKRYKAGLIDGLAVAERILGRITQLPESSRKQQIEWAEEEIREIKERNGL